MLLLWERVQLQGGHSVPIFIALFEKSKSCTDLVPLSKRNSSRQIYKLKSLSYTTAFLLSFFRFWKKTFMNDSFTSNWAGPTSQALGLVSREGLLRDCYASLLCFLVQPKIRVLSLIFPSSTEHSLYSMEKILKYFRRITQQYEAPSISSFLQFFRGKKLFQHSVSKRSVETNPSSLVCRSTLVDQDQV